MRKFFASLRPFLEPTSLPFLFVLGVIIFSVGSNAIYDWAKERLGTPARVAVVALVIILLLVLSYEVMKRFRLRLTVRNIAPRRGLVVLISQGKAETTPAAAAIEYHLPALEHCWLITSTESQSAPEPPFQSAWKNASQLKTQYQNRVRMHIKVIDPEDPQSIFHSVEQVYQEAKSFGLTSKDIVADFTGGTKMMTAGMVLACTPEERDVQYMKPLAFLSDGQADRAAGSEPRWVDLNFFLGKGE